MKYQSLDGDEKLCDHLEMSDNFPLLLKMKDGNHLMDNCQRKEQTQSDGHVIDTTTLRLKTFEDLSEAKNGLVQIFLLKGSETISRTDIHFCSAHETIKRSLSEEKASMKERDSNSENGFRCYSW